MMPVFASRTIKALAAAVLLASASPSLANEPPPRPDVPLADPMQEARAKALFKDIRCVVCQHESIVDSPASIAADMRGLVREQIASGVSDDEIQQDLVRRYGDYVLFRPPFKGATLILWLGPFLLVAGAGLFFTLWSRRRIERVKPLSEGEEAELAQLLSVTDAPIDPLSDEKVI